MATPLHLPAPSSSNNPTRLSAACQQITTEHLPRRLRRHSSSISGASLAARIVIRSSLSDPQLWPVVAEHKCNGISLTPSGLYADMAVTVAQYIWHRYRFSDGSGVGLNLDSGTDDCEQGSEGRNEMMKEVEKRNDDEKEEKEEEFAYPGFKVFDLDVTKPLIVTVPQPTEGQWIEMETLVVFPISTSEGDEQSQTPSANDESEEIDIADAVLHSKFRSITASGTALAELAHCSVRYEDWEDWLNAWSDITPAVMSRISHLHSRALTESGAATTIRQIFRDRAYELFRSFVDYTGPYRNMAEVVFDTATLEATSTVEYADELTKLLSGAGGLGGPFWLDGSCHVSGFVCNAVEPDREKNAYISHGIDSMRIAPVFNPIGDGGDIRNYVRMEKSRTEKSVLEGDVYIAQDGRVVGLWEGVKFKKIPRRVLNVFLPPPMSAKTTATTASTKNK